MIGYKMSYYRSMYGIDVWNADLNHYLLRAKPLCLTPDQHAHVNCLSRCKLPVLAHFILNNTIHFLYENSPSQQTIGRGLFFANSYNFMVDYTQ